MDYVIDKNAKNAWIRDNGDTMDLSPETDAGTVYLNNGRTLEQELGEGSMVSNVVTVNSAMSKVIDGTYDGAYESCVFKGQTKWIDNDTNEILDSFVANRNLSLIDVKMPVLKNVGKNLFDINGEIVPYVANSYTVSNGVLRVRGEWYAKQILPLKTNTKYTVKMNIKIISGVAKWSVYYNGTSKWITSGGNGAITFTTPEHFNDISILFYSGEGKAGEAEFSNIQVEESSTTTPHQPHKSNTLTTPEEIILRSLPNGVQDTYNPLTGEYVKRVGEIVLDGRESRWEIAQDRANTMRFNCFSLDIPLGINTGLLQTNKLPYQSPTAQDQEGGAMLGGANPKVVCFSILKTKLTTPNVEGLKTYLQSNPVTVHYELATPIIKKVEPKGHPFAYENGHVILESSYQGQSLLPTMDYSTVVNRTGQIKSIGEQSLRQDKQINKLEQMLVGNIIAMNYNNTLLKLNLTMNEVK